MLPLLLSKATLQQEVVVHHLAHTDAIVYNMVCYMNHLEDAVEAVSRHAHRPRSTGQLYTVGTLCGGFTEEPFL